MIGLILGLSIFYFIQLISVSILLIGDDDKDIFKSKKHFKLNLIPFYYLTYIPKVIKIVKEYLNKYE